MRSFSQLWPTLKRLLAYGSPWRKPLGIAVLMMGGSGGRSELPAARQLLYRQYGGEK